MSSEYRWVKDDLKNDDVIDFSSFEIKKWLYIEKKLNKSFFI